MTRLCEEDIDQISLELGKYNEELLRKSGCSLWDIALHSAGRSGPISCAEIPPVAVVPITSGEGIIGGFAQTVRDIIIFLGCRSYVTAESDVGGLAQAIENGSEIIFLADDYKFIAVNIKTSNVADNSLCTGRGYAAALESMAGGISAKETLVIGAGPVGFGAAEYLSEKGAEVYIFDSETIKSENLKQRLPAVKVVSDLGKALKKCKLIVEATPSLAVIKEGYLSRDTFITAPGIPLGLSEEGAEFIQDRLIHDALEIGVASMLCGVLT